MYYLYVKKSAFHIAIKKWFADDGDNTLRLDYPLGPDSIVLDVGGFEGNWAFEIYSRYKSQIHIFEPVSRYYFELNKRFTDNHDINVNKFGLSDIDETIDIAVQGDGSSTVKLGSNETESINLKDISNWIDEHDIQVIDLMKINIEGGEYKLLERMIEKGLLGRCKNLQIQFHDFFPDAKQRKDKIRSELMKTHELTYDYEFVWENWKLI